MRILLATTLVAFALLTAPTPSYAQDSIITTIGSKIAGKLISTILGHALGSELGSIFGGEEQDPVTIEEISDVVSKGFADAAVAETQVENKNMSAAIRVYNHALDADKNWDTATAIVSATASVQSHVETHISKGNSLKLIPLYIAASNARLAFLSEQLRYIAADETDAREEQKKIISREALKMLTDLNKFMSEDFRDPHRGQDPCITKKKDQRLFLPSGTRGSNLAENGKNIKNQYCLNEGRIVKDGIDYKFIKSAKHSNLSGLVSHMVMDMSHVATIKTTDIMEVHNAPLFQFALTQDPSNSAYYLFEAPTLVAARVYRNRTNIAMYGSTLGRLDDQTVAWLNVIRAFDDSNLTAALKQASYLGLSAGFLKNQYHDHGWMTWHHHHFSPHFSDGGFSVKVP